MISEATTAPLRASKIGAKPEVCNVIRLVLILASSVALAQQAAPPAPQSASPADLPSDNGKIAVSKTLLPDVPKAPNGQATRIGGTIARLDRVLDVMTVQPFGGGDLKIAFDPRTTILRGSAPALSTDLKPGERISLDAVLDGNQVFARTIRILPPRAAGESNGQVVSYNAARSELVMRDPVFPKTIDMRITPNTTIVQNGKTVSRQALVKGALIAVQFDADSGGRTSARQISILGAPGRGFVFAGLLSFLDLRGGRLTVTDPHTGTNYDLRFKPGTLAIPQELQEGRNVSVTADFDGQTYEARSLVIEN
jgi:hypothetical protein